jgi:predicted flap endonuclease-1-like 5' DNA nuclease
MFEQIPFSGYLICYGPLALVIFGFIFLAARTDKDARRTYLRILDPRPEKERPVQRRLPTDREMMVSTPSGLPVMVKPDETEQVKESSMAEEAAPPAPVEEVVQTPDDLRRIEGIGPKLSGVLQAAGITTFAALATRSPDELRAILDDAGISAISDPTSWPEQARLAAEGKWDELEQLQDELKGGRRD